MSHRYAWGAGSGVPATRREYKRRHDEIWPEMLDALRDAGGPELLDSSATAFTLFGYFETDDLDETIARLGESEVNRRWAEYMAPVMKIEIDPARNFPYLLPLQWHMD